MNGHGSDDHQSTAPASPRSPHRASDAGSTAPPTTRKHRAARTNATGSTIRRRLPRSRKLLAVCAHPDDESFGLGAILAAFTAQGTRVRELCFTRGEASTLGNDRRSLATLRARELNHAARLLGVEEVQLLDYPDSRLQHVPLDRLISEVDRHLADTDLLLTFDTGGISGHPDHRRVTEAALAATARSGTPVLAWTIPEPVAAALNAEFGTAFIGAPVNAIDIAITPDRQRQRDAIRAHDSQARDNAVLWRRLELLGAYEYLRWLGPSTAHNRRDERPAHLHRP